MASLKNILEFEFNEAKEGFYRVTAKNLGKFSDNNRNVLLTEYQKGAESPIFSVRKFTAMYSKYLV